MALEMLMISITAPCTEPSMQPSSVHCYLAVVITHESRTALLLPHSPPARGEDPGGHSQIWTPSSYFILSVTVSPAYLNDSRPGTAFQGTYQSLT